MKMVLLVSSGRLEPRGPLFWPEDIPIKAFFLQGKKLLVAQLNLKGEWLKAWRIS